MDNYSKAYTQNITVNRELSWNFDPGNKPEY